MPNEATERLRIQSLLTVLGESDDDVAQAAEIELANIQGISARDLQKGLLCSNPLVRFRVAWVLGRIADPMATIVLQPMCMDRDERVRYDALQALAFRRDAESVVAIARILVDSSGHDDELADAAATALRRRIQNERGCMQYLIEGHVELADNDVVKKASRGIS